MCEEYQGTDVTQRGYFMYISEATGDVKQREIEFSLVNGRWIYEGDIVINTQDILAAAEDQGRRILAGEPVPLADASATAVGTVVDGCVIVGAQYRWPNGIIPYSVDLSLPNQARVTDAIAHWEDNTPIRFIARTTESAYVRFIPSDGCWSYVGRQGSRQDIGLADGCLLGSTIHEIGHAVGLWHEQSREDRDTFVTVHYQNITPGREHNFDRQIADGDDVGAYDYGSIMHYGRTAFTKNGLDTITPPAGVTIGQRNGLSTGDIQAVVYMYGEQVLYIGNKRTRELHAPGCQWARLMSPRNKKYFTTQEEAVTSGYNGCWYCMRHFDTG
ncbi:MAG: M12 family metallopeptidase [Anaerolineae bacterium]|nr:M12 family metallopeptidase [Anaerolineae bacterium]